MKYMVLFIIILTHITVWDVFSRIIFMAIMVICAELLKAHFKQQLFQMFSHVIVIQLI
jgi:hypothetical protein